MNGNFITVGENICVMMEHKWWNPKQMIETGHDTYC